MRVHDRFEYPLTILFLGNKFDLCVTHPVINLFQCLCFVFLYFSFFFWKRELFFGRRSDLSKLYADSLCFCIPPFFMFGKWTSVADAETNSCKIVRQLVELSRLVGMPSDGQHRWISSLKKASSKDFLLYEAITKYNWTWTQVTKILSWWEIQTQPPISGQCQG